MEITGVNERGMFANFKPSKVFVDLPKRSILVYEQKESIEMVSGPSHVL